MRNAHPDVKLDITDHATHIAVDQIVVPADKRDEGVGTRIMQKVIDRSESLGKPITLTPSTDFGGTKSGLDRFYKGFDFVKNTGRNALYESSDALIRYPKNK